MKEREIIDLLLRRTARSSPDLLAGIGDDCAVIKKNENRSWLVTMDTLVEGVHFDRSWHAAFLLGRKSVSVNISDIAAMGGTPAFIFLSLGLPEDFDHDWLDDFSRGLAAACKEYECLLAGGDTVRSPAGIVVTLAVLGEAAAERVVLRSGAQRGDTLWVSGTLGKAAAGLELCRQGLADSPRLGELVLAHLDPRPRLQLGRLLAQRGLAHAMIDLSDGLATDLAHLCVQSGVGVRIDSASLPAPSCLREAARILGNDSDAWIVAGGEDYELAFAAAPSRNQEIQELAVETGIQLSPVGAFDQSPGVRLVRPDPAGAGKVESDIAFAGYDHFSTAAPKNKKNA